MKAVRLLLHALKREWETTSALTARNQVTDRFIMGFRASNKCGAYNLPEITAVHFRIALPALDS
jgi:hypothetical protein